MSKDPCSYHERAIEFRFLADQAKSRYARALLSFLADRWATLAEIEQLNCEEAAVRGEELPEARDSRGRRDLKDEERRCGGGPAPLAGITTRLVADRPKSVSRH
jgi:hypothetical protein